MSDQPKRPSRLDDRAPIDARIDTPGREGLTGTAPATLYAPLGDTEHITIPPDGRPMDQQPAWRHDFPIDWPQDHYVERRDFMKFMVLTSLALTISVDGMSVSQRVVPERDRSRPGEGDGNAGSGAAPASCP